MSHYQCPVNSKLETRTINNYPSFVSPTGTFFFVHQFFQDTPLYKYFEHPMPCFQNSEKFIFYLWLSLEEEQFLYLPFL
jgi:hypothetical protein